MAGNTSAMVDPRSVMQGSFGAPLLLIIVLAMMTLPVPAFFLDIFFSFNIAFALVVILVTVYTPRPLEFALFPTIILVATLLRLALNVASTRVVLLDGHLGGDAAGQVIQSFGEVVIGGNYAVGLVVFAILMIINFVVVTKGAGRISEVTARFTLDAMPGKQMAIDADLNAGLIEQEEAKARRAEIGEEADFYGAMDGASKFVRGDAIAGILILVINLLGGVLIGMLQHDLSFSVAMERYALLTIGDGLVAQIPSLLLSTGAAIIVTRVSRVQDMREQVIGQLFQDTRALYVTGFIFAILGIVPGMPHFTFLLFAGLVGGLGYYLQSRSGSDEAVKEQDAKAAQIKKLEEMEQEHDVKELGWDDVQPVDMLGLEVGYRIIPLVDKAQGGQLLSRIKGVRKKLSQELGFLMPSVHIRDNLDLLPSTYQISLMGVSVGEAEVHPEKELAINPGQVFGEIEGIEAKDPAFGLDAVWIEPEIKEKAQTMGYTVVDASTVIATHLNQVMIQHASELIGHEEVQQLLEQLNKQSPKLVESLVPNPIALSTFLKILQALLKESVSIRDIRTIAEALADCATHSQDPDALLAAARVSLSRGIVQELVGSNVDLPVISLQSELEQLLQSAVIQAKQAGGRDSDAVMEPGLAEKLQKSLLEASQKLEIEGKPVVLLVSANIRPMMARFARSILNTVTVLSFNEIPENKQVTVVASIGND